MMSICHSVDYSKKVFCWSLDWLRPRWSIPLSWVGFKNLLMWGVHLPGYPEVSWVHLSDLQWHGKTSAVWNCKSLNFKFAAVCIAAWGVGKMNAICTCCTSNILYLHVACRENQDDISLDLTSNKLRKQHELMGFKTSSWKMVSVGWNHQGWENEPVKTVWVYLGLCPKIVDTFPNLMALHVFCENNSAPVDLGYCMFRQTHLNENLFLWSWWLVASFKDFIPVILSWFDCLLLCGCVVQCSGWRFEKNHRWFQTRNTARPDPELRWPEVSVFNVSTGKEAYRFDRTPDSSSCPVSLCVHVVCFPVLQSALVCGTIAERMHLFSLRIACSFAMCYKVNLRKPQMCFSEMLKATLRRYTSRKVLSHLQLYTKDGWDPIWF
jgi:hypothetical protein